MEKVRSDVTLDGSNGVEDSRFFNLRRAVAGALVFPIFPYLIGALANGPSLGKDVVGFVVVMIVCSIFGFVTGGRSGNSSPSDEEVERADREFLEEEARRDSRDAALGWGSHPSPFGSQDGFQ
mgnify:CR=1 FL=1